LGRPLWRITLLFLTAIGVMIALNGCYDSRVIVKDDGGYKSSPPGPPPWAPAHGHRAKYRYQYYPSSEVYVDSGRGVYFHASGGQWRASASLPVGIRLDVNHFVTLEMNTERPYTYHSEITKKYPPGQQKKTEKKNKRK
jgi:hypothetical protein